MGFVPLLVFDHEGRSSHSSPGLAPGPPPSA
jgi:hypothetical protein